MKIGIVNAGNIGLNLTAPWVRKGHEVMVSKDTHSEQLPERVAKLARDRKLSKTEEGRISIGSMVDAADFADVVVFAVYFPRFQQALDALHKAGVTLKNKIVIDTMNPLNVDANFNHYHDTEYMARTSTTEEVQKAFPEAKVTKAFSVIPAGLLSGEVWGADGISMMFVGGDSSTSSVVRQLIEDAGFNATYVGPELRDSRLLENLGLLLHRVAENEYGGDADLAITVVKPTEL